MRSGGSSHPSVSTLTSATARYLQHLRTERRLAAHTVKAYERDAQVLATLAGERPLAALGPAGIRRFVAALHGRGLAPRSLARLLSSWRGLFDFMVRLRERASNPCAGVKPPKAAKRLPAVLSPDEAVRLVAHEDASPLGQRDRALFELAYSCGLRVS